MGLSRESPTDNLECADDTRLNGQPSAEHPRSRGGLVWCFSPSTRSGPSSLPWLLSFQEWCNFPVRPFQKVVELVYLGAVTTPKGGTDPNLRNRLRLGRLVFAKLKPFFRISGITLAIKLAIFQAVVVYSLESEALLPSTYKRLDTLGMKVLCSILKVLSALCSHIIGELVAVRPLSHVVKSRRFQLLTHNLRDSSLPAWSVSGMVSSFAVAFPLLGGTHPRRAETTIELAVHKLNTSRSQAWKYVRAFCRMPSETLSLSTGPRRRSSWYCRSPCLEDDPRQSQRPCRV